MASIFTKKKRIDPKFCNTEPLEGKITERNLAKKFFGKAQEGSN